MKKNILTLAALLIASATFVACSSEDNISEEPAKGQYTMTIQATKGGDDAVTRALTLDESGTKPKLKATWDANEKVLVYQGATLLGTLSSTASENASTTLSGTLSGINEDNPLLFYFHTDDASYGSQDGSLATIATSFDFCVPATVTKDEFTVDTEKKEISIPNGIQFVNNLQAIAKFTIQDMNGTALNATHLNVKVGLSDEVKAAMTQAQLNPEIFSAQLPSYDLDVTNATYESNGGTGIIYLAIPSLEEKLSLINEGLAQYNLSLTSDNLIFTLTATVGSGNDIDKYVYTKTGFPFEVGNFYAITVKMKRQPALGDLYYSDGTYSKTLESNKTPIGVIAYLDDPTTTDDDGITEANTNIGTTDNPVIVGGHGLVLCLKDKYVETYYDQDNSHWSNGLNLQFGENARVQDIDDLKRWTDVSGYTNTKTLVEKELPRLNSAPHI